MDQSYSGDAEASEAVPASPASVQSSPVPDYLSETYYWAYLSKWGSRLLDHSVVVSAILWGNANRLIHTVLDELNPGERVLQSACVYGDFSRQLANAVGPNGRLDVIDVAPIQVKHCRRKLGSLPQARVHLANAATWRSEPYDKVCCFFLLHEVPEGYKQRIVNNLLEAVRPGGKVVFVDYHRPRRRHPLRHPMKAVFNALEPYASTLWEQEIASYAHAADEFSWNKRTYFGELYQKVVAQRR